MKGLHFIFTSIKVISLETSNLLMPVYFAEVLYWPPLWNASECWHELIIVPWVATVNPKAWREGLSQHISRLSFSPTSDQKSSKGVSIIVIMTNCSLFSVHKRGMSHSYYALMISAMAKWWYMMLWYTRGHENSNGKAVPCPSDLCGGQIETEKHLSTTRSVTVLLCIGESTFSISAA